MHQNNYLSNVDENDEDLQQSNDAQSEDDDANNIQRLANGSSHQGGENVVSAGVEDGEQVEQNDNLNPSSSLDGDLRLNEYRNSSQ